MSLLTRLWLTVVLAMLVALSGSFVLNVLTARDYLAQQLYAQASDSAASLALSMSQQAKDPAMSELLVSALFDSGHFESVRYMDVNGKLVVERHAAVIDALAPGWFVRLIPLEAQAGEALVSDGWKQAGSVYVKASARFAYASLWRGTLKLAGIQLAVGILLGFGLTFLMRWAWSPLRAIVGQAVAIGQRRFIRLPELSVPELRVVGRAMNVMVERVQAMFAEQTERINALRDEANHDAMTALPNRERFIAQLKGVLQEEHHAAEGGVIVVRLLDLAGVNRRLGRERADALIGAAAALLRKSGSGEDMFLGRLNGADFAVIVENYDIDELRGFGTAVLDAMAELYRQDLTDRESGVAIGVTPYQRGESFGAVLLRADDALMQAETMGPALVLSRGQGASRTAQLADDWRLDLDHALTERTFEEVSFPTLRCDGTLLHDEIMLRMRNRRGDLLNAGQFMPAAMRLKRTAEIDVVAVELALERIRQGGGDVAVNLSPLSLVDPDFFRRLGVLLADAQGRPSRLWVEISERGLEVESGFAALERLAGLLADYGAHLGIEHFGRHFSALPQLYALRLDYIKLDGGFIAGIDQHAGNQRFVKAVANVAHSLDIQVIAERVSSLEEWRMLSTLGVDGVTGPAVAIGKRPL